MKSKIFAVVVFLLWTVPCFAQYVDTAWVRRYNGPGDTTDIAYAVAVDSSGNVYVTGASYGSGSERDYATIKYYPNGDTAWVRRYNGPGNDYDWAWTITLDGSGNVYVGGLSWGGSAIYADYATIKYYPNGDTAWVRRYNGPGNFWDDILAMVIDDSNNVYLSGASFGSGGNRDYATIKYNTAGTQLWVRRYSGPGNDWDEAKAIAVDDSDHVYVTGFSVGSGTNYDYATIKYYPNGDTAWVRRYNGPGNFADYAYALVLDASGNIYVTGASYGTDTDYDFATIKYDPNGDTVWTRRYNGPGNNSDLAGAIVIDCAANIYVFGSSVGSGTNYDYATIMYDSSGKQIWVRRYNGPGNDNDGHWEGWNGIDVDNNNNVYVTGHSVGIGTYEDFATIKYIQYDSIPFAPAINYGAGVYPHSVFCTDLDADDDIDLAVTNNGGDDVSILKNNGDGTFQNAVNYGTGSLPRFVFCADLDGDTDLDLAVANWGSNNVSILKNDGDGTFQTSVNYGTGDNPQSAFCADLDNDADLDLATGNEGSDNISILKNNGDGTFQTAVTYAAGDCPWPVFCADLDGDTDLDLAVANVGSDNISILKNNGDGTFQTKADYGAGDWPRSVFCADLDGDGDLDLAVANYYSDNVSILKNNGDGTFQTAVNYGAGNYPYSVFCADLDGDTDLDLAVANEGSENVSILKNNGDGTFQSAVNYGADDYPFSVFCADLDGDTDLDLAVANWGDGVSILENLTQLPANQPPWAFSLITPANDDSLFGPVTLQWQIPYDPNFGDQIRYDLYVSTEPGFDPDSTAVYDSLSLSKHKMSLENDAYYWKVKAYDNWGAETWSTETWSFSVHPLPDTLWIKAYSPVDLIVTDPMGDSISVDFNTIQDATYDDTIHLDEDEDTDDLVTIPHPYVGEYRIRVIREDEVPPEDSTYDLGIRINGSMETKLVSCGPVPPPGEEDTVGYDCFQHLRGDANGNDETTIADVVFLINYILKSGEAPDPVELGDVNCDGNVDIIDAVYLVNYLFRGGEPPCS
ncbi:MAG: FG-GAP-like repeat-containing protein [Candidatus Zixiibacteriota bacterium]